MGVEVRATGVVVRAATEEEAEALSRAARPGGGLHLQLDGWYSQVGLAGETDVYVVTQAFVEFDDGGVPRRWENVQHFGHFVSCRRDVTIDLLQLARETAEDLTDLLADMRIADLGVSRWQLMSAPHRIDLDADLEARLAPLRRG